MWNSYLLLVSHGNNVFLEDHSLLVNLMIGLKWNDWNLEVYVLGSVISFDWMEIKFDHVFTVCKDNDCGSFRSNDG